MRNGNKTIFKGKVKGIKTGTLKFDRVFFFSGL